MGILTIPIEVRTLNATPLRTIWATDLFVAALADAKRAAAAIDEYLRDGSPSA